MVGTTPLQFAGLAGNASFLNTAAAIGGAMQLAYANKGFKYDDGMTQGAARMKAQAQANFAENEIDKMKDGLDPSLHGPLNQLLSQIREAMDRGDFAQVAQLTHTVREMGDTARALQTQNNNERNDVQARLTILQAQAEVIYDRQRELLRQMRDSGEITQQEYQRNIQALDNVDRANAEHGFGSPEAAAATETANDVARSTAALVESRGGDPARAVELRDNATRLEELNNEAGTILHDPSNAVSLQESAVSSQMPQPPVETVRHAQISDNNALLGHGYSSNPANDAGQQIAGKKNTSTSQPLSEEMRRAAEALLVSGYTPVRGELGDADVTESVTTAAIDVRTPGQGSSKTL